MNKKVLSCSEVFLNYENTGSLLDRKNYLLRVNITLHSMVSE